jgi:hypothetical protein
MRVWNEVFQALEENNFKRRILQPAKLSLLIEGEIQTLHDRQKVNQYLSTKPTLQKILK